MPELVLAHDYLLVLRGAERTFAAMSEIWPEAPIVTLLYDPKGTDGRFSERRVLTSQLQRLSLRQDNFRRALPVYPSAVRRLPVGLCEAVVSSSSAFAHGVRKPPDAVHVCYCHSPFRYAWHEQADTLAAVSPALRPVLRLVLWRHRRFDLRAVRGVDQFVANSRVTQERIKRFWGRDAPLVHPPVEVERFFVGEPDDYVLFVGELVRHKRADVAIEAAAAAGRPIKVVGAGPELRRLQARYSGQAEFLGRVSDERLRVLYAHASALVVPSVEEFGVAAVEAQAAGRPVVGIDAGGVRETVVPDQTGLLVPSDGAGTLARALREDLSRFDPHHIRRHAMHFGRAAFQSRLREIVETACEWTGRRAAA